MELEEKLQSLQMQVFSLFLTFTLSFLLLSLLLLLQRLITKPLIYCNCDVCTAYINSTWTRDFVNLSDWFTHLLRRSPTNTVHVHVLANVITANPDNVEYMLHSHFHNFPKGRRFSSILADFLGRGIFNVDGACWSFQRKLASLELGSVSVRSYAFAIASNEVHRRLLPLLSSVVTSSTTIDLQDVFRRFSFDTICKISFGLDPGCLELSLPVSEFAAAFDRASCLSAQRALSVSPITWKLKRLLNLGSERELRQAIGTVNTLADELIRQRRKLGTSTSDHDLLSRFMGSISDDKYLRDIVVSFLLAGRDTVASGLTTFFYLLSTHPEVVSAIRDEIDRTTKKRDSNVNCYDELRSMSYVHAAIYESLRLYPPVQFDSKFCAEDDVLPDGTFVKKGTRVTYHPYAMGRMEGIWGPDCRVFRPERWLSEDGVFVPESPFRYPVFQGGARVCLGKEMAIMEMKTIVVAVVGEFDLVLVDDGSPPRFSPGLTATVRGGLHVRVTRRRRIVER